MSRGFHPPGAGAARRAFIAGMLTLLVGVLFGGSAAAAPNRTGAFAETTAAPAIVKQPVSKTVSEGKPVSFEATASGKPAPSAQWEVSSNGGASWSQIAGATATKYTIAVVGPSENGYQFRATFTNSVGVATTAVATLSVNTPPAVTAQPISETVQEGQNATFEAAASGRPAANVLWQSSTNGGTTWSNINTATSTTLTIAGATTALSGDEYRAVFTNSLGKATSEAATLTVQKAPAVSKQPANVTVAEGQSASFEAAASGFPAPGVQWELSADAGSSWSAISGATATRYTIATTAFAESGDELRATFTNGAGTATSSAATLTVLSPPVVTRDPLSTTVKAGERVVFEGAAGGTPTPTTQWEISTNGGGAWSAVAGETSEALVIEEAALAENGVEYRARFTNSSGTAISNVATLTVATNKFNAVAWGQNTLRQLGDGSISSLSPVPVPVSGLAFVAAIAAGGQHSLALLANGTVMAWGSNQFGQLGDGSELTPSEPVQVSGLAGVKAVAAGSDHSLALLANGTVVAWGANQDGQLGNGTISEASQVPVAVNGLSGVRAIAAGGNDSFALMANGTVMSWGDNESGELGDGTAKLSSDVPIAVKRLTGVKAIAAGGDFALALLSGGTVQAWGSNQFGQLANSGAEEASDLPVPAGALASVASLAAGSNHALALLSTGTVMAWGEDSSGQLGNGTFKLRQEAPTEVGGLSGVSSISAGGADSAALLSGGAVVTWGLDNWGQLGHGAAGSPSAVPLGVEGVRKVAAISAGGLHMVAYGEPIPIVTALNPSHGTTAGGTSVTISGEDFEAGATVKFAGAEASAVTVVSPTSITATAPPGSGTVNVIVTTSAGSSPPVAADRFTYVPPPQLTKIAPKSGTAAGGTTVTLTGANFIGVTAVRFGGVPASSFTLTSSTTITAVAPAEAAAAVQVSVTSESGTTPAASSDIYKFAPVISSLSPNSSSTAGGVDVTVTGAGFAPGTAGTKFKFGSTAVKSVSCASSTQCTMIAPAHEAATVEVKATVNKVSSLANPAGADFSYG
ncbi:MAG TPA: IPT/TIG domain-containing protein [Solirubrobacteraceae bacterium]